MRRYESAGAAADALRRFADDVGSVPLTDNREFKNLLRKAGRQDPVMKRVQDKFFDKRYYRPAMKWVRDHEMTLPLSALVVYDSFIHSGRILWFLRQRFAESPPSGGGDEKAWVTAYVNTRHDWLRTHSRQILRKTIYRTACFKTEIQRGNWGLSARPIIANGTPVSA